jgi:3-oxoadipate enol-lactonase
MRIIAEGGKAFECKSFGDSSDPAIILIHGLGAESGSWRNQIDMLSRLGYFVLIPDMFGHGESDALGDDPLSEWNLQINEIFTEFGMDRAVVCGVSMGGVIAMNFAVSNRSQVSGLVISDSFAELRSFSEKALGFSQVLGFSLFRLLGRRIFANGMASAYKQDYAAEAREYLYQRSLNANFDELLKARKAINTIRILGQLSELEVPSLVTVGAEFGTSFIEINRKIADKLAGSEFVVIPESMDPSPLVNPGRFNAELERFLANHQF